MLGMNARSRRFDDQFRQDVLASHQEHRIAYYEGRLDNAVLANHRLALSAVCELLRRRSARGKTVQATEALDLLEVIDDLGRPVQDGEPILNAAVAKGVLGQNRVGLAVITAPPIQSMQTHLRNILHTVQLDAPELALPLMRRVDELEPPPAPATNPWPEGEALGHEVASKDELGFGSCLLANLHVDDCLAERKPRLSGAHGWKGREKGTQRVSERSLNAPSDLRSGL